ncbi:PREDICTED: fatty acid-binding protein, intestinal-like [Branchiostoma belcheri]|uniref:Fatty acid-binding protein, intestinal-like n=1 Tax=Branchiostoma belcheri TaxID=7741 RepID=A0A6P4ZEU3_BRABE|nr:PREDICTED: fatty acid-binding protein, intestinal-like [Branchiostoma belcheri]
MPFDLAKWNGTWKQGNRSDNYQQIMEKLGVPAEGIQKFMESELSMDATLSGNVLTTKVGFLGKTIENSNTLGQEGKETGAMSNTIATVWSMEGDYLIAVYPDFDGKGLVVSQKRRFVDDNKIMTEMKAGDLEGWVEYIRC